MQSRATYHNQTHVHRMAAPRHPHHHCTRGSEFSELPIHMDEGSGASRRRAAIISDNLVRSIALLVGSDSVHPAFVRCKLGQLVVGQVGQLIGTAGRSRLGVARGVLRVAGLEPARALPMPGPIPELLGGRAFALTPPEEGRPFMRLPFSLRADGGRRR